MKVFDFGLYQLKGEECTNLEHPDQIVWCWTCGTGLGLAEESPEENEEAYWRQWRSQCRQEEDDCGAVFDPQFAARRPHP